VPISGIGSRYISSGEMKYLEPLVKKYGDDIHGMSHDRKLNPEQRTVGQLRRGLRKSGMTGAS
jgi:nucleolar protein 16